MVFAFNNQQTDLDPLVQQLVRKVLLLRRVTAKYPALATTAKAALCAYEQQGKRGTTATLTADQHNQAQTGPIGHLLTSLHQTGLQMDTDFNITHDPQALHNNITKHGHTKINILNIPWQHLAGQIEKMAQDSRFSNEAKQRKHLQPTTSIDQATYQASLRLQPTQPPSHPSATRHRCWLDGQTVTAHWPESTQ